MNLWPWIGFVAFVLGMLALDLGVFHCKAHAVSTREAAGWTVIWVVTALAFNGAIYFLYKHHLFGIGVHVGHNLTGTQAAIQFFTGYVIEKSLSLDNIFVIALVFAYFGTPVKLQHRVLFYGILGALVMRGAMIAAGAALIERFDWITYVFGVFLIITAIRMLLVRSDSVHPDRNPLVRLARRVLPVSGQLDHARFFTRIDGRWAITPLFLVLIVVESSDLLFAVDSIPAIFAITHDPFLVFTSNIFAILGLRSLYFVLAGAIGRFRYLKTTLVVVLAFVGVKMLLEPHVDIPTHISLLIIALLLAGGIVASVLSSHPRHQATAKKPSDETERALQLPAAKGEADAHRTGADR